MTKWEKERLIFLVQVAVSHAIYANGYYAENEKETLKLLDKWEKEKNE